MIFQESMINWRFATIITSKFFFELNFFFFCLDHLIIKMNSTCDLIIKSILFDYRNLTGFYRILRYLKFPNVGSDNFWQDPVGNYRIIWDILQDPMGSYPRIFRPGEANDCWTIEVLANLHLLNWQSFC